MTVKSTGWSKCSVSQYPVGILLRKVKVKRVEGSTEMPYFEDVAMRKPARMNGKNRMWLMHSVVCMMALALSVPSLLGQGSIEVDGTVRDKDTNQKLSGVEVSVLQDGQPYDVVRTLGNGKYTLSLDHGADYQLVFTYEDLSVRSVEVNTSTIPDAFRERPFFLNVEMSLFEVPPGFDQSLLDEPIGKVSFDESKEKLDWDLRYTRNMQNRIESALESAAESGGAEADEGGDAPATNRAYEEHMRKAEVEFGRGRYEQSINWLERALNEVPGDARAEAMMEEAVELQAEAEEAAAIDADYERLMREGKIQLKRKEWEAARTALESASELKPDEAEPRELLAEIPSGDTEEEVVSEPVQEEEQGEDDAASARADRPHRLQRMPRPRKRPTAARSTSASLPRRTRVLTSRTTQRPRRCTNAANLMPEEQYPVDRAEESNARIVDMTQSGDEEESAGRNDEASELDRAYEDKVREGDEAFDAEDWATAKSAYEAAQDMKPMERYPKNRLPPDCFPDGRHRGGRGVGGGHRGHARSVGGRCGPGGRRSRPACGGTGRPALGGARSRQKTRPGDAKNPVPRQRPTGTAAATTCSLCSGHPRTMPRPTTAMPWTPRSAPVPNRSS